jgi:ubiquinone/menaquinone biosynthesis C-methylase UbiE
VVDGRTTTLVAGRAEALPLGQASVDVAWLSTMVHQFGDLDWAVDELRVLTQTASLRRAA